MNSLTSSEASLIPRATHLLLPATDVVHAAKALSEAGAGMLSLVHGMQEDCAREADAMRQAIRDFEQLMVAPTPAPWTPDTILRNEG